MLQEKLRCKAEVENADIIRFSKFIQPHIRATTSLTAQDSQLLHDGHNAARTVHQARTVPTPPINQIPRTIPTSRHPLANLYTSEPIFIYHHNHALRTQLLTTSKQLRKPLPRHKTPNNRQMAQPDLLPTPTSRARQTSPEPRRRGAVTGQR